MSKLPKRIFVKQVHDGDLTYLEASDDAETLAGDVGNVIPVGIYELTSTAKLATKAEFQADKAKAKKRS